MLPGTRCCGLHGVTLITAGLPTGCRYAAETFYGTMTTYVGLIHWRHGRPVHVGRRQRRREHSAACACRLQRITNQRGRFVRPRIDLRRGRCHSRLCRPRAQSARGSRGGDVQRVGVAEFREHTAGVGRVLDADDPCTGGGAPAPVSSMSSVRRRSTLRRQRGQTLVVFALGFALFLFSLTALSQTPHICTSGRGASRMPRNLERNPVPTRESRLPLRCRGSVSHSRFECRVHAVRSSTSARRIVTVRCTPFSAPASRRQTSRHRSLVTRRRHRC